MASIVDTNARPTCRAGPPNARLTGPTPRADTA
jgi:hypothetical protein